MKTLSAIQQNFEERVGSFDKAVIVLLFFIFGIISQLNDLLVPHLYEFGLSFYEALMLHFTFFTTYLVTSYPSAKVIDKFGYKTGILIGLATAAVGSLVFYFAVENTSYYSLLIALIFVGTGVAMIQIAANGYVVLQSKPKLGASNLAFAQAFNSLGRVLTVLFGMAIIFSITKITQAQLDVLTPEEYISAQAQIIKTPYLIMVFLIVLTGVAIYFSKLPEFKTGSLPVLVKTSNGGFHNVLQINHLLLGSIAIFAYVGAEVSIGTNLIRYLNLPEVGGGLIDEKVGMEMLQYYWGSMMVGRIIGGFILRDLSPRKVVAGFAASAAIFVLISVLSTGQISVISIVEVGFFNSILFPSIFTLGINGLGHFAEEGASILIASIVGGAIIPLLVITVADFSGLQFAFLIPVACYSYIVYFSLYGSHYEKEKTLA
jgi:FHS family L-fucose permease-like MFS transporter